MVEPPNTAGLNSAHRGGPASGKPPAEGDLWTAQLGMVLAAVATGKASIEGAPHSAELRGLAAALAAMGAKITESGGVWHVVGCGVGGLSEPSQAIDATDLGAGVDLLLGVVAGHDMKVRFEDRAAASSRGLAETLAPLLTMGAEVAEEGRDRLPLTLRGTADLVPVELATLAASDGTAAAVLLAGLHAAGTTTVIVDRSATDDADRLIRLFGGHIDSKMISGRRHVSVSGHGELVGARVNVRNA